MLSLTLSDQLEPSDDVAFRDLQGEAVLLDLATGRYFGLDEVGTRAWSLLLEHRSLRSVHQHLLAEYDVASDALERDLLALMTKLVDKGLLRRPAR